MDRVPLRKPRLYFDTSASPGHVTFDDGREIRRNLPWLHYVEGRWPYADPDTMRIEIGEWLVLIRGHNLEPLFQAIEEQTLVRLRARPELDRAPEHLADTFAIEVRFTKPVLGPDLTTSPRPCELDFGPPT
jgi:hypothetical protein